MLTIIIGIAASLVGIVLGWLIRWLYGRFHLLSAENRAERLLLEAEQNASSAKKDIILQAKEGLLVDRRKQEQEMQEHRSKVLDAERRLSEKEADFARRVASNQRELKQIAERGEYLKKLEENFGKQKKRLVSELEKIAGMSAEEAKHSLITSLESDARNDAQIIIKKIEQEATNEAQKKARQIVVSAIQRVVPEINPEMTTYSVALPNEDMKGRIIGKEGRNIRALELATGVDIVIDDTPDVVIISCFDPVRREIGRQTLETLMRDGRIHPSSIEETAKKVQKEINELIKKYGEETLYELEIHHINPEAIPAIGRLHFRQSYGQNVLNHSKEVAIVASMIAGEVGCDREITKRGGILHDVGKSIESDKDRTHVELGVELAKRIRESEEVINCIEAHHGDVPFTCPEAAIVQAADSISASRPGARRESVDNYLKRLRHLEEIAAEFEGVEKAYAIQAGRELRILVNNEVVDDNEARSIAQHIARTIEQQMQYPGRIKVTMIRETRVIEYAH